MNRPRQILFLLGVLITVLVVSGCSVKMAANARNTQRLGLLAVGQDRYFVVSQLGEPQESTTVDGTKVDHFIIYKNNTYLGYTRAVIYGLLDMGTLGLWELIGTPMEDFIQSHDKVMIYYDSKDKVKRIHLIPDVK